MCVPRGKERSRKILADHVPLASTVPPVTENELVSPSMAKFRVGFRAFPDLSTIPLPLLEVKVPLMSRNSPAAGLEVIGSNVMLVGDLTVIVLIIVDDGWSVSEPFEPLNIRTIGIKPRGRE